MVIRLIQSIFLLFLVGELYGQERKVFDPILMSITEVLPPLSSLLDSASVTSPILKAKDSELVIAKLEQISVERKWLEFFSADARFSWGKYDNLVQSNLDSPTTLTSGDQTRYAGGVSVRIPFHSLFTLKLNNKIAHQHAKVAHFQHEAEAKKIRELVIRQYNDLVLAQEVLMVKSENAQSLDLLKTTSEKMFKSGRATLAELTSVRQTLFKAKEELARARNTFVLTYLLLQESTGMKFNLL